ncbi:MAG: PIN domain-containing protein [Nitrospirae bacterium]|nr:PIN domain-containing protein [Nitrospirota bacterium]
MIVVDTSVLIPFLKGSWSRPADRLREAERDKLPVGIPSICGQEVLQGARDPHEWSLLLETLSTQRILVPADQWQSHVDAARIFFDCRRKGITIRSTVDCLIAQIALECDGILLHDDEDFERIRKVRPLRTMR